MMTAEQIVKILAEQDAPISEGQNGNDYCVFCGSGGNPSYLGHQSPVSEHDSECPWRLAREWKAAQVPVRKAVVGRSQSGRPSADEVRLYLPGNYAVTDWDDEMITIEGQDVAGWTMDGYVIPRLASGLIAAREVTE